MKLIVLILMYCNLTPAIAVVDYDNEASGIRAETSSIHLSSPHVFSLWPMAQPPIHAIACS